MKRRLLKRRLRGGQTLAEYMMVISFTVVALSMGFIYLSDSVKDSFDNARNTVQRPFP